MKSILKIFVGFLFMVLLLPSFVFAQQNTVQKLKQRIAEIKQTKNYRQDTAYANAINQLGFYYADNYPDSAIQLLTGHPEFCKTIGYKEGETEAYKIIGNAYVTKGDYEKALLFYEKAYQLAVKNKNKRAEAAIMGNIGNVYFNQGNYSEAIKDLYNSLKVAENTGDQKSVLITTNNIGNVHFFQGKMDEAAEDYKKTLQIAKSITDTNGIILAFNNLGEVYIEQNNLPSAIDNLMNAYQLAVSVHNKWMQIASTKNLGYVYYKMDSLPKSVTFFKNAYVLAKEISQNPSACKALIGSAKAKLKMGLLKDALADALEADQLAQQMGQVQLQRDANEIVANVYEAMGNGLMALKHFKEYKVLADSLHNFESERVSATLKAEFNFSKKELEFDRKSLQQRWLIFSAFAALFTLFVIFWIVNRNRKRAHYANKILQQKNNDIEHQKSLAEEALIQLQSTQKQLLQAEKMASLGEMTAGIAHEIQNPLNFVNNFSEVSAELIDEMKAEIAKGNYTDAIAIANDVKDNMDKILVHGKRADSIVKGMLQHSRKNSGVKEPTELNVLCDEYLRLAFHGLKAKDKTFNAKFETDFDKSIGKVNIIPQEIGRVILNLINNAFYAVNERKKSSPDNYEPTVILKTKKLNNKIEISIADNGKGIPKNLVDKIFQPFFTTKPTGQGTGLGLSLSYDIVTKGHDGEMKVNSKEGEGAEFVIILPV
jgi:two-component system, NtrC family, sensor kinase